jgi:hypothetical protein
MHWGTWVVGSSGWSLVDLLTGGLLRPPDTWLLLVIGTGGRASIPVRMLAWAPARMVVVRLSSLMVYIVLVVVMHHGCSSKLLGTHPTTIHYTPSRFIVKDPGLQPNWEIHQYSS